MAQSLPTGFGVAGYFTANVSEPQWLLHDYLSLSPVTQAEILGHPLHNHVLPEDDCLSPPATVARLLLKTATLEDIEVYYT